MGAHNDHVRVYLGGNIMDDLMGISLADQALGIHP